jgi:hypothetical protein
MPGITYISVDPSSGPSIVGDVLSLSFVGTRRCSSARLHLRISLERSFIRRSPSRQSSKSLIVLPNRSSKSSSCVCISSRRSRLGAHTGHIICVTTWYSQEHKSRFPCWIMPSIHASHWIRTLLGTILFGHTQSP